MLISFQRWELESTSVQARDNSHSVVLECGLKLVAAEPRSATAARASGPIETPCLSV
jgi:hypothetical protein